MTEELAWIDLATFPDRESTEDLLDLLKENQITFQVIEDPHQMGDSLNLELQNRGPTALHIQVMAKDAERAQRILALSAGKEVNEVEDDDYLSGFSDHDLLDVLHKPDEWNQVDYQLAIKFLKARGIAIEEAQLHQWAAERLKELEKPDVASSSMITGGYIFALAGGLIGFLIGLQLATFSKRLPNGHKVPMYGDKDRRQGFLMIGISLFAMAGISGYFILR